MMEFKLILPIFLLCYSVFAMNDTSQNSQNSSSPLLLPPNNASDTLPTETEVSSISEPVSFHSENRTAAEELANYYDEYEYDMTLPFAIDDASYEDSDVYDGDRARWSYAPAYFENKCRQSCLELGKPFSRLLGVRCQCLCPLNAPTLSLCGSFGKCDKYCAGLTYYKGGDCVYNNICFCYCKGEAPYDVSRVYS